MTLPTIAAHARMHGISPQKKLGQNFIFDLTLCDRIVRTIPSIAGKEVLEIGPGPGGLTRAILAQNPSKLTVIEKDPRCLDLLLDLKKHYPNLEIISADALKIKISDLTNSKLCIISNLPYNIGTELVFRWLEYPELIESMTLMLQKEVVDRICSKIALKSYGKLSIMCQVLAEVRKEFDVLPAAFYPPPKVHSAIVNLFPKQSLDITMVAKLRELTHTAFMFRRKMLKKALPIVPEELFKELGIDPQSRPEELPPETYVALAKRLI